MMSRRLSPTATLAAVLAGAISLAACGGSDGDKSEQSDEAPVTTEQSESSDEASSDTDGIQLVAPSDAAATLADPPADLVVLDVRTQEEFDAGHVDGAVVLDFYRDDFAEAVAALDRDVPYVVYCQSGNRSGQTRAIMTDLGFSSVDDVDGGIIAWQEAGLPVVTE